MMKLSNREKVKLTVSFSGERGIEARPFGVPEWSCSDESIAKLEVSDDGMTATLTPEDDAEGEITVTTKADVDIEKEGRHSAEGMLEIEVEGEDVATASIKVSDREPKTPETDEERQKRRFAASYEEQTGKELPSKVGKRGTAQMTDEEINKRGAQRLGLKDKAKAATE